jgi:nitrite reductase/ring-hydroxylating ferredoxin subunit
MGKLMRRYWVPVMLVSEIAEPDCPPVRVQILGERLLAFRDTQGRIGLVDEFCAHRGVSLFLGRNEEGGIRCSYHGWKYDVTGQCTELPSMPHLACKMKIKSYPVHRARRRAVGVHGPARQAAAPPEVEWCLPAREPSLCNQALSGDRLPAGDGRRHRHHARIVGAPLRARARSDAQACEGQQVHQGGSKCGVRSRGVGARPDDLRPAPGRGELALWRITQWIFPVVHADSAVWPARTRRAHVDPDRRRELLGVEHQLPARPARCPRRNCRR